MPNVNGQIDTDVAIPDDAYADSRNGKSKYPFQQMNVGDSFGWDCLAPVLSNAARSYGLRHGKKFVVRTEANGGCRCWRIE